MMLRKLPGVFVPDEMIDWEAPTGGYLLHGCITTQHVAPTVRQRRRGERLIALRLRSALASQNLHVRQLSMTQPITNEIMIQDNIQADETGVPSLKASTSR